MKNASKIKKVTICGGHGRNGIKEAVEKVELNMGNVVSIVGLTGSGKTALINDIALFANGNTPSGRTVLINDKVATEKMQNPAENPIALITQHTNFLSDLPVKKFLETHISVRQSENPELTLQQTLDFANQLTGEPILLQNAMTELSGGQARALLIADAVVVCSAPIVLLDEIENAGIYRTRALELLKQYKKIFIFVTHDPVIALLSDFRILMQNGAMQKLIVTDEEEKEAIKGIKKLDDLLVRLRDKMRAGEHLTKADIVM